MKTHARIATVFLAAATFLMPFQASALSVNQFEKQTRSQQTESVLNAVDKIVADVAKVNPPLSRSIHDYFEVTPAGQKEPPGLLAFTGSLGAVEELADQGKFDLDRVQIEGILLDIIKTDLMPQQITKNTPPSAPIQQ